MTMTTPDGIAKLRARMGLTQQELARVMNVHHITVGKWERGILNPNRWHEALLLAFDEAVAAKPKAVEEAIKRIEIDSIARTLHRLLSAAYD